jgi:ubiquinone biosynthesis protein
MKQIFEVGFFHADPHPGNILVLPGEVVAFLDFGLMGSLSPEQREILGDLMIGLGGMDAHLLARTLQRMSYGEAGDFSRFREEVHGLLMDYAFVPSGDLEVGEVLRRLTGLLATYRVQVHPVFYLLLKALVSIEGIARSLDPDFDLVGCIRPYARQLVAQRYQPKQLLKGLQRDVVDLKATLRGIPDEISGLLQQARRGELNVRFEHRGLRPLYAGIQEGADRLAVAVVVASLIVGSSLVILAHTPPMVRGIPILGLAGYLVAGLMGFYLLVTSLFRKRD